MAEKKPDSVGSFLCLMTKAGKVRYQMRTEKRSLTGISYKGDFELPGGKVEESDLCKALTVTTLIENGIRETQEELGIEVTPKFMSTLSLPEVYLYRTVFENPKDGKVDWAFAVAVPPEYWDETAEAKRKVVDADPDELNVLGRLNLIVSGRKRMWRMGQAGLYFASKKEWSARAAELLTEVKPDWKTEILLHPFENLDGIRYDLELRD